MTETCSLGRTARANGIPRHVVVLGGNTDRALRVVVEVGARAVFLVGSGSQARPLGDRFRELGLEVEHHETQRWPLEVLLQVIDRNREAGSSEPRVLLNVAGADRQGTSAGTVAGYIRDIPVLDVVDGEPRILPRLAFTYEETVSETKRSILEALDAMEGRADQLQTLADEAGIASSLASYHVRGGRATPGLEEQGLVEIEGDRVGELAIQLTAMGRLVARRLIGLELPS